MKDIFMLLLSKKSIFQNIYTDVSMLKFTSLVEKK